MPEISRKVEGISHEFFQYWEAKKNQRKIAMPPTRHKSFRCPKVTETQRVSPANFIGSKRDILSTEKSDITLLGMNFFDSRTLLIYRSVPQRKFPALWDKKFSTESRGILFFLINFFGTSYLKLSEKLDGSSRSFLLLCDQKIRRKIVILQKVFEIPNHLKLRSGYHELFWYCETKKFRQKNVIFRSHA